MLAPALADPDPVLLFEHAQLYNLEGELPDDCRGRHRAARGAPRRARDVSLITYGGSLPKTLEAAEELGRDGIDAEVHRPARAAPAGRRDASWTRCASAAARSSSTRAGARGSLAAEVMARIVEQAFYDLDAPLARVCSEEVPIPYAQAPGGGGAAAAREDRRRRSRSGRGDACTADDRAGRR